MIRLKYIALIFLVHNQLKAQGPPITTETPIMLGLEGSAIRTFLKITDSGDGHLSLPASQVPSEEDLGKIVTDAGFTLKRIDFSNAPFLKVSGAKKIRSQTKDSSHKKILKGS
ncbi:MAG: hypothetical protein OEM26_18355 [Saprospiraceae bacterium]|nr:hypothetical protein [Saprospiraceae bacterium]